MHGVGGVSGRVEPLLHLQRDPAPRLQKPLLDTAVAFPCVLRAAVEEFVDMQGLAWESERGLRRGRS